MGPGGGSNSINLKEEEAHGRSSGGNTTIIRSHYEVPLRALGLVVTLVALVVIGIDKETKIVPVTLIDSLPPLRVPLTAKWQYLSAFVYLLVINAMACAYAAGSLIVVLVGQRHKNNGIHANATLLAIILLDMVTMALLFSGLGAAAGVGVVGRYGNSHVQWKEVCTVFEGYCRQMAAAVVLTFAGCLVFLWLVMLAVSNLHTKCRST